MRFFPLRGVSGSGRVWTVGSGVLDRSQELMSPSEAGLWVGAATDSMSTDAGVASGIAIVNAPDGALISIATVAGWAGVADFVAKTVVELEATDLSV